MLCADEVAAEPGHFPKTKNARDVSLYCGDTVQPIKRHLASLTYTSYGLLMVKSMHSSCADGHALFSPRKVEEIRNTSSLATKGKVAIFSSCQP